MGDSDSDTPPSLTSVDGTREDEAPAGAAQASAGLIPCMSAGGAMEHAGGVSAGGATTSAGGATPPRAHAWGADGGEAPAGAEVQAGIALAGAEPFPHNSAGGAGAGGATAEQMMAGMLEMMKVLQQVAVKTQQEFGR